MRMNTSRTYDTVDTQQLADRNQLVMDNIGLVKALALRMARRVPTVMIFSSSTRPVASSAAA